jgi:hypothetical protein
VSPDAEHEQLQRRGRRGRRLRLCLKWLNINTGFGNDQVSFANNSLLLERLNYCTFAVNTGADQDKIYMDDGHANFGHVYHVTPGKFSSIGVSNFNYWNTETFGVGGGMQENTFDVVPSWYTKYQLYGHGLQPNYANTPSHLALGLNGVTNPARSQTGPNSWTYTFGNCNRSRRTSSAICQSCEPFFQEGSPRQQPHSRRFRDASQSDRF